MLSWSDNFTLEYWANSFTLEDWANTFALAISISAQPVGTTFLASDEYRWFHPRGWNPSIFPNLDQNASVEVQQTQWLSDLIIACDTLFIPNTLAVGGQGVLFWDGMNGQEHDAPISYIGDPSFYVPEAPQTSVRAVTAHLAAAGLKAGTIIRPTIFNNTNGTQIYSADSVQVYTDKTNAAIADGFSMAWMDSALDGPEGGSTLTGNSFFDITKLTNFAYTFLDFQFFFEWWSTDYIGLDNIFAYHDPAPGYLPDFVEDPAKDKYAIFSFDQRSDPRNSTKAEEMAASFRRGARIFLYVGANFLTNAGYTDDQRATLYKLWLDNYLREISNSPVTILVSNKSPNHVGASMYGVDVKLGDLNTKKKTKAVKTTIMGVDIKYGEAIVPRKGKVNQVTVSTESVPYSRDL